MKKKRKAVDFWKTKVKPYLKNSYRYKNKIMEKEIEMFDDDRSKKYYRKKMKMVKKVVKKLRTIPWIMMIGITGSVATEWPKKDDDIDFMIICQNNRLWLCRLVVIAKLKLLGFRVRSFLKNKKDGLCFNLWLEEKSVEIEKSRQGMLTALEILWMKPVFIRQNLYKKFLTANNWINKYVKIENANIVFNQEKNGNKYIDYLNTIAYELQYKYMKNKIRKEIISKDKAYFHPQGKIRFDRI